ncbi:MAG: YfhO family protein [Leptospiraceae bacterium]|nr:YfhO family protein [Leptospiraceae bacterium]MDW7975612.1 hypothetical protein [Leptospiraceae bacterium]
MKKLFSVFIVPLFLYFFIFVFIFYKIYLLNHHFITHDNFAQFYVYFVEREIWNLNVGYGFPAFAEPQWQFFYPFKYLFPKSYKAFDFYILHYLLIGAYFTFLTAYYITNHFVGSFAAGIVFSLSGSMAGQISMMSVLAGSSYLPANFYFFYRFLNERKAFLFFLWVLVLALHFLVGHPQFFAYSLIFNFFFLVFFVFEQRDYKLFFYFLGGVILSLLLTAYALLPQWELLSFTLRKKFITFSRLNDFEFPLRNLIHFIYPFFWGGISSEKFLFTYIEPEFKGIIHNFHEQFRYFGLLPLFFVFFINKINKKSLRYFIIFSLILYFIWALGSQTFFSKIVYNIPILNRFRGPSRHFLEITFLVSLITAIGFQHLSDQRFKKYFFGLFILFIGFFFLYIYFFKELQEQYFNINYFTLSFKDNNGITFQWLILLSILIVFLINLEHQLKAISLFFVLLLDLGLNIQYSDALVYTFDHQVEEKINTESKDLQSFLQEEKIDLKNYRYFRNSFCVRYDIKNCSWLSMHSNWNSLHGYKSVNFNNPLLPLEIGYLMIHFYKFPLNIKQWNIGLYLFQIKGHSHHYYEKMQLDPFLIFPLILDHHKKTKFEISVPKEFYSHSFIQTMIFYLSAEKMNHSNQRKILTISFPKLQIQKEFYYQKDISNFKNNCEITSPYQIQRKNLKDCDNLYKVLIPINTTKQDLEIHFELLESAVIHLYGIEISDGNKTEILDPKILLKDYFTNPELKIHLMEDHLFLRYQHPVPKAFFPKRITTTTKEKLWEILNSNNIDFRNLSYVHTKEIFEKEFFQNHHSKVELIEETPTKLILKTSTQEESFLVIWNLFYPSWIAKINGNETKIHNTNIIGMGIFVPKGENQIELVFSSNSLRLGLLIAGITIFLIVFFFLFLFFIKKKNIFITV